jgi:hypothetical protein
METSPRAPERRLPAAVLELQRESAFVQIIVAAVLVLSIMALVYAMSVDTALVSEVPAPGASL